MNNTNKNTNSLIISSTDGTINAFINGKAYTLSSGSYYYPAALAAAKERNYEKLIEAIDLDQAVKKKSSNKVTFEDGIFRYNGSKINDKLANWVIKLVSDGYKLDPLMNFMENCYENSNPAVVSNLYDFLATYGIMIDDEGWVVGWKKVREDGYDYYSGTVLYEVGKTVKIPIEECSADSRIESHYGLHVGSRNYAENLWYKGQGKLLVVRVHPKNIVCVPEYSSMEKLRACEMDVLEEFQVDKEYKSVYVRPKSEDYYDDSDTNFEKDIDLNEDFYSENDSEFGSDSKDYLNCGCNCDSCNNSDDPNFENSDSDSDNSDSSEDDDLDYGKYSSDNDTPTGWSYKDPQDYIDSWNYAVKNKPLGPNADYKEPIQRYPSGQFAKGNIPTAKRGPGGRFIKNQ